MAGIAVLVAAGVLAFVLVMAVGEWARRRRIRRFFRSDATMFAIRLTRRVRDLLDHAGRRAPELTAATAAVTTAWLGIWVGWDAELAIKVPWVSVKSVERVGWGTTIMLTLHAGERELQLKLPIRGAVVLLPPSRQKVDQLVAHLRERIATAAREEEASGQR